MSRDALERWRLLISDDTSSLSSELVYVLLGVFSFFEKFHLRETYVSRTIIQTLVIISSAGLRACCDNARPDVRSTARAVLTRARPCTGPSLSSEHSTARRGCVSITLPGRRHNLRRRVPPENQNVTISRNDES